jgi:hypothetical protein
MFEVNMLAHFITIISHTEKQVEIGTVAGKSEGRYSEKNILSCEER